MVRFMNRATRELRHIRILLVSTLTPKVEGGGIFIGVKEIAR